MPDEFEKYRVTTPEEEDEFAQYEVGAAPPPPSSVEASAGMMPAPSTGKLKALGKGLSAGASFGFSKKLSPYVEHILANLPTWAGGMTDEQYRAVYGDEEGAIEPIEKLQAKYRAEEEKALREHPGYFTAGDIGGAMIATAPLLALGGGGAGAARGVSAAEKARKAAQVGKALTGAAAAEGALRAAGETEDIMSSQGATDIATGAALGYGFGKGGQVLGKGLKRGAEAIGRTGAYKTAARTVGRAVQKAEQKMTKLAKSILAESDPVILEALKNRPEKILSMLKARKLSPEALSRQMRKELSEIKGEFGARAKVFRKMAKKDTDRKIGTKQLRSYLENLEDRFALEPDKIKVPKPVKSKIIGPDGKPLETIKETVEKIGGGQTLASGDLAFLKKIRDEFLQPERISPRDALLIVDKIDSALTGFYKSGASSNISAGFAGALKNMRGHLKDIIRKNSKVGAIWDRTDDAFNLFMDHGDDLLKKLSGDQRVSFANNLLNKNKDPLRQRLTAILNIRNAMQDNDAGAIKQSLQMLRKVAEGEAEILEGNYAKRFFNELADVKTAQKMQATLDEIYDPIADRQHRLVQKWMQRGGDIGAGVGAGGGMGGGMLGFGAGYVAGKGIGKEAGRRVGKRLANPYRILKQAEKAKKLTEAGIRGNPLYKVMSKMGKYGQALEKASQRSGQSMAATHYVMMRRDPKYREAYEKASGEFEE